MKIRNPNWHPESSSQLTVAQRMNCKRLLDGGQFVVDRRKEASFVSLVRHGLAKFVTPYYQPTAKLREWRKLGYI